MQSRGEVPEVYGGKDLWKRRFWAESETEGVKEGGNDDDVHELPWVTCDECEGDWLIDRQTRQEAYSRDVVMQNNQVM